MIGRKFGRVFRKFLFIVWVYAFLSAIAYIAAYADPVKVMIIDTGIELSHPEIKSHVKEPWNFNYIDNHGHGTAIASIILKDVCNEVELISCKYYEANSYFTDAINGTIKCFKEALRKNVQYINYSSSGNTPSKDELEVLKELELRNVTIAVATGNNNKNLLNKKGKCTKSFPSCYQLSNIYPVGALDKNGNRWKDSNYGNVKNLQWQLGENIYVMQPSNQYAVMSGTSMATANYTNFLLKKECLKKKIK